MYQTMRKLIAIIESAGSRTVGGATVEKFYHGTPMYRWNKIETQGLIPSSASHPGKTPGVYLTHQIGVAIHYAEMCFGEDDPDVVWAILEVDASALDPARLVADGGQEAELNAEDIMARGYTLEQIWAGDFPWEVSLEETGQAIYQGAIPASAIRLLKTVP